MAPDAERRDVSADPTVTKQPKRVNVQGLFLSKEEKNLCKRFRAAAPLPSGLWNKGKFDGARAALAAETRLGNPHAPVACRS